VVALPNPSDTSDNALAVQLCKVVFASFAMEHDLIERRLEQHIPTCVYVTQRYGSGCSQQKSLHDDPGVIVEYPLGDWIYRSISPRRAPSIGSIMLNITPAMDAVVLDSDIFQSSSSARILEESAQYDWEGILAMIRGIS